MKNDEKGIRILSHSETYSEKAHMFFVSHLGKFGLAIILFLIVLHAIDKEALGLKFMLFGLVFVGLLTYLALKFHEKFAHKLVFDFGSRRLKFYMYRSEDVIEANFEDIRTKLILSHVIFILKDRRIFYRGSEDSELLDCLNRISRTLHKY